MRNILLIFFCTLLLSAEGQNLVSNPSFENFNNCPTTFAQIHYCDFWFQPNEPSLTWQPPSGSSDYYNVCGTTGVGVPSNNSGFQFPRTGNAYAGISFGWYQSLPIDREYLEVGLVTPLLSEKKYCGGYYVSLGEAVSANAVDRLGMYLDNDSVFYFSPFYSPIIKSPQVENAAGNVITDTVNWVLIKGVFVAQGGERFVVLGNFRDSASTTTVMVSSFQPGAAYYYIDDVFIEEMQVDTANAGGDATICEGDSIQLGTAAGSGCIYTWQPAIGLSDTTVAQPTAAPAQTTTYILTAHDTSTGTLCDWTSTDTVTVTVIPFTPQTADAGADKTLCKGESVTLGTAPCSSCTYQWQPATWLSDATIAQPTATPQQTTAYVLTMTDSVPPCTRTTSDNVTVFVEDCTIEVFNIFTPNGDTKNDFFFIKNLPPNSALQIFNRWGGRVYESSNYNNQWDGGDVPDGTYYYILVLSGKETFHGFVEIRR
jgi:gliding motility-associated-like protein